MSIDTLLKQTATIYPKTGYNKYGRDISSTGSTAVKCRFQNQTKTKLIATGQVIQLMGIVYLDGAAVVNTEDRIVIGGVSYKVFSVNGNINGRGIQKMIKCEVTQWQIT